MKSIGAAAAALGLAIAVWLICRDRPEAILALLREAGGGLLIAAAAHGLPMLANAADWRLLLRPTRRPPLVTMLKLVLIRESINGLLPVARIGGEVVSFRLLRGLRIGPSAAIASLVVDMQLTLISQVVFALLACAWLLHGNGAGSGDTFRQILAGLALAVPVLALFAAVQHARPFRRLAGMLNRVTSGGFVERIGASAARIDLAVMLLWRNTGMVLRYLLIWQTLQFMGFSLEIWLALHALGAQAGFVDAMAIEALIQFLSSMAFLVPAGIGIQEGGFVVIGGLFGLDPALCLALAGARRLRDLLFYLPGLALWQLAEWRAAPSASMRARRPGVEDRRQHHDLGIRQVSIGRGHRQALLDGPLAQLGIVDLSEQRLERGRVENGREGAGRSLAERLVLAQGLHDALEFGRAEPELAGNAQRLDHLFLATIDMTVRYQHQRHDAGCRLGAVAGIASHAADSFAVDAAS